MSDAEEIVRALAEADPCMEVHDMFHECALCMASLPVSAEDHEVDCPWRLASEWVAARSGETTT